MIYKSNFAICLLFILVSCSNSRIPTNKSNDERLKFDLIKITTTPISRNYQNPEILNNTASYIYSEFKNVCDSVKYQKFNVDGITYKNIIASVGTDKKERLIIGAHYDVCGNQQGADDNASGIAGVLELARLLSKEKLGFGIDFVAYCLEEPPFFGTKNMGSYVHAKSLFDQKIIVKGMICLEMIGYFNDAPNSQKFPLGILRWFYGNKGNFITIVQKYRNGKFGEKFKNLMIGQNLLPTKSFWGPESLHVIDFSDHRNYWEFGYSAVMITNTSFYRNPNYHKNSDTIETLDIARMAKVIDEIYISIINL